MEKWNSRPGRVVWGPLQALQLITFLPGKRPEKSHLLKWNASRAIKLKNPPACESLTWAGLQQMRNSSLSKHKTINYRLKEFSPVQPPNHMFKHCELIKRNSTFSRAGTVIEFHFIHKSSATSIKFQIEQLSLSMWIRLFLTIACVMKVFVWLSLAVVGISGKNCMVSRSIKSHLWNGK